MNNKSFSKNYIVLIFIAIAALSRMFPHMHNFSPLGAISLFGAAYFTRKWQAIIIPLAATWLSDLFLNNFVYANSGSSVNWFYYQGFYWQYIAYLLITFAGFFIFKKINVNTVLAGALCSTFIFFIVSNFGAWASTNLYTHTFEGLLSCYIAAIPFIKGTIMSDLLYTSILFGSFYFLQKKVKVQHI